MANRNAYHLMRQSVHITDLQRAIIIGTVLGDGSLIETFSKNNLRLQIDHCAAQKEYVLWKYEALKPLVLTPPTFQPKNRSWRFRTISHPDLTEIGRLFYQNRQKIVPREIASLLEPIGLAIWFMDDGTYHSSSGYLINTQNFTHSECLLLRDALAEKFGIIHTTMHRDHNGWRLYIRSAATKRFREIVKPFMLASLMYKLEKPRRDYTLAPGISRRDEDIVHVPEKFGGIMNKAPVAEAVGGSPPF